MQGTLRTTGALVAKCLEDTVKNLGLLVICILPVGFTVLYQAVLGGAEDARHVMSWFVFPTMLTFATTMAPPTIALYTTALDREKGALRTLLLAGVSLKRLLLARGIASVLFTAAVTAACFLCAGEPLHRLLPLVALGAAGATVITLLSLVPAVFARNQTDSSLYSVPILFVGLAPMFFQYGEALIPFTAYLPTGGMFALAQLLSQDALFSAEAVLPAVLTVAWIAVAAIVLAVALRHAPRDV